MLGDGMVPLPCGRLSGLRPLEPPVLKQSGLSAVALAKVESTVTRVLPALWRGEFVFCERSGKGADYQSVTEAAEEQGTDTHPASGVGNSCFAAAWCRCHVVGCSFALEPPFFSHKQFMTADAEEQGTDTHQTSGVVNSCFANEAARERTTRP